MQRYSIITAKMPREFVLLQGMGCRWGSTSQRNTAYPNELLTATPSE